MSKYNPKLIKGTGHRDIESLHPVVQPYAKTFLAKANESVNPLGYEVRIISTLRTWAEQDALYAQGRTKPGKIVTKAQGGRSNHNWGVAFDIGIFKNGKYITDDIKIYDRCGPIGENCGLDWGGRWNSPIDRPHYQFTGKLPNSQFLAKVTLENLDELLKV